MRGVLRGGVHRECYEVGVVRVCQRMQEGMCVGVHESVQQACVQDLCERGCERVGEDI